MNEAREYKGMNGTIVIDGASIRIERSGVLAKVSYGRSEPWSYPIFAVSGVSSNEPGSLKNGWLTIQLGGQTPPNLGATTAGSHPNTVMFTKQQSDAFDACLKHLHILVENNAAHEVESEQFVASGTGGQVDSPADANDSSELATSNSPAANDVRADIHAARQRMTAQFGGKREIKRLEGHLHEGEEVRLLSKGRYGNAVGIVVLTTQRLIFLNEGLVSNKIEDFPLDKISSVQSSAGMLLAELKIFASGNASIIDQMPKQDQRLISEALRQRIASDGGGAGNSVSNAPPPAHIDVADQLAKFAALRDQGVITDEEFAAQKSKLLGM